MSRVECVLLAILSASIMSLVGIGGAFVVYYFFGLSLVYSLCAFMFIILFIYALSGYLDDRNSQRSFTRLRLEKDFGDLFWYDSELQARFEFLNKVSEVAPDSELKKRYQANKRALHELDRKS